MAREDEIVHLYRGKTSITPNGGSIKVLDCESTGLKVEGEQADATGSKSEGWRSFVGGLKTGMISTTVIFRIDENPFESALDMHVNNRATMKLEEYAGGGYWTVPVIIKSFDKPIFANTEIRKIPYELQITGPAVYTPAT